MLIATGSTKAIAAVRPRVEAAQAQSVARPAGECPIVISSAPVGSNCTTLMSQHQLHRTVSDTNSSW
jgi:hypothetical protein